MASGETLAVGIVDAGMGEDFFFFLGGGGGGWARGAREKGARGFRVFGFRVSGLGFRLECSPLILTVLNRDCSTPIIIPSKTVSRKGNIPSFRVFGLCGASRIFEVRALRG